MQPQLPCMYPEITEKKDLLW